MDWKDLMRGGGVGRGGDPYVNEKSPFAKFPLAKKGAAPLPQKRPSQKAAVAAASAAPGALWKQPTPPHDFTPRGGPGGGTMTGQAPPNPLQAAVDAGGHGYPQIARDQGYGMQQMADTGRLGLTPKMGRLPASDPALAKTGRLPFHPDTMARLLQNHLGGGQQQPSPFDMGRLGDPVQPDLAGFDNARFGDPLGSMALAKGDRLPQDGGGAGGGQQLPQGLMALLAQLMGQQ